MCLTIINVIIGRALSICELIISLPEIFQLLLSFLGHRYCAPPRVRALKTIADNDDHFISFFGSV